MESDQNQVSTSVTDTSESSSGVSFPSVIQPKKSSKAKTLLVIGILVLVGVLGYLIFKNSKSTENKNNDVITNTVIEDEETPTPEPTSTPTAKPVSKSDIKVQVQNGTGITGEAAFLEKELKKLGFEEITVGNASDQNQTETTVTYSKNLAKSISDDLTEKLKALYKEVNVKTSSTASTDIVIVTGLRKGATAKPSPSVTPKASSTGTPKSSSSPSVSPSASPTATP